MRFVNPIVFVSDIDRSKAFYQDRLNLKIFRDFGRFVLFESGFGVHDGKSLEQTIWKKTDEAPQRYGQRNVLLYFEDDDIPAAFEKISPYVELIHAVERQEWGQHVFRFYDADGHVVEIGEPQLDF